MSTYDEMYKAMHSHYKDYADELKKLSDSFMMKDAKKFYHDLYVLILQYSNLRHWFDELIQEVFGTNYYNEGMDVYNCDKLACEDLKRKCMKRTLLKGLDNPKQKKVPSVLIPKLSIPENSSVKKLKKLRKLVKKLNKLLKD